MLMKLYGKNLQGIPYVLKLELDELRNKVRTLAEQNCELQMLVSLYEKKSAFNNHYLN